MADNSALVVGATGATASRLVEHLAGDLGWKVYGACRTPPSDGAPFIHVGCDLMDFRLASWMADKQPMWSEIVMRNGLCEPRLEHVAHWEFGDFVFAQDYDVISDLGRIRRAGFCETLDTQAMFTELFDAYRKARILP